MKNIHQVFKSICQICNRAFSSPRGTLSSKRIGGAVLLSSAIFKGFIVIAAWIFYKNDVPSEIIQIISAELLAGTTALGLTLGETKFKTFEKND